MSRKIWEVGLENQEKSGKINLKNGDYLVSTNLDCTIFFLPDCSSANLVGGYKTEELVRKHSKKSTIFKVKEKVAPIITAFLLQEKTDDFTRVFIAKNRTILEGAPKKYSVKGEILLRALSWRKDCNDSCSSPHIKKRSDGVNLAPRIWTIFCFTSGRGGPKGGLFELEPIQQMLACCPVKSVSAQIWMLFWNDKMFDWTLEMKESSSDQMKSSSVGKISKCKFLFVR